MMNKNLSSRSNLRNIIPHRLREARLARGLTIKAVAEHADVSPQAISRYELGELTPGAETFMKIQRILNMPLSFYEKPYLKDITRSVEFFRSFHAATKASRDSATIKSQWISQEIFPYLDNYIKFPLVDSAFFKAREIFHAEDATPRSIEALTKYIRKEWKLSNDPIDNLVRLLEQKGVIICLLSIDDKLDAFSFWENGRPFIIANKNNNAVRLRATIAHELGHLLMHSAIDVVESLKKWEEQAKLFSSMFLMPKGGFDNDVISTSLNQLLYLKQHWKVSVQSMVMRCEQLEIISNEKATYLWKEISRKRWRKNEPLDNEIEPERPVLFQQAISLIIDHGIKTKTQLLHEMAYPVEMACEFCSLPDNFYSESQLVNLSYRPNTKTNN